LRTSDASSNCETKSGSFWQAEYKRNTIGAKYLPIWYGLDLRTGINLFQINIKNTNNPQQGKLQSSPDLTELFLSFLG
jgi:hypothetical protein